jgi:hypothetical protein
MFTGEILFCGAKRKERCCAGQKWSEDAESQKHLRGRRNLPPSMTFGDMLNTSIIVFQRPAQKGLMKGNQRTPISTVG